MAKKIAAPFKAASKAPARKISKAKAVSAPKTHKPKGSPKEKLAYLNKGEMAALVKRKGTPARKGPRGLPSFADDSASSKGVSRGDKSGTKSSSSGNKSGVGGGGGGGGGSTGSRGSSTGGVGSRSGSNAPGNSGTGGGGKSGPGGPSGPNSAASGTRGFGGPSSPMGGQGRSFSSPQAASYANSRVASGRGTGMRGPLGPNGEPSKQGQGFKSAAPKGKVGTPRGYVDREALNRVDTAMKPLQAVGEQVPYFAPGVGPMVGSVFKAAAPAVGAVARGVSSMFNPAARSVAQSQKVAEALKAVEAYQKAAAARGQVPGSMAVDYNKVRNMESLAAARGRQTPFTGEKAFNRLEGAIDAVTNRMGHGTGEVARAKAVSQLSASHGLGRSAYEAADAYDRRSRADVKAEKAERARGKTDFGGYRAGGLVKSKNQSRKTFKNK